ncbi:Oxidoreductase [Paraburkholderia caribensis MBA4]|uniref:Oxidoreductase n=1 Tax=Paraburkholderia caribensis MBA4 TaxID=1323664 RepID=A0A0P0RIL5_9BURK|nr:FAD-binding oxidoreductase [Paraburkholderia caribensis]ALL68419.1 Oxidoreductase [Paraburkholderia caribensis MBA4]
MNARLTSDNVEDVRKGPLLRPYWEDARRAEPPESFAAPLPSRADVVVVGAGLTGVEAARVLTEGGRSVIVLDAGRPGAGASTRNAGQIGRNFKHSFGELCANLGEETARRYFGELRLAYDAVAALGEADGEAIGWRKCSRVIGALSPAHLTRLTREYEHRARVLGEEIEVLDVSGISEELRSPLYHGGVRIVENGAIHPGLYYEFMERRALAAGARIEGYVAVQQIERATSAFEVRTTRGTIACGDVLVATNGYTDSALGWFKARLAPINSYMIATEALPATMWESILPRRRTYHDNRRRSHFMTFSPDGSRLMFGGRTGNDPAMLRHTADDLTKDLRFIFPALADVRITHAWTGRCAATGDLFPHVGVNPDGVHYALGYCFSGNAMGPYLARKAAARILGKRDEAQTIFDSQPFKALPLFARSRWTMLLLLNYYAWADRPKGLSRAI